MIATDTTPHWPRRVGVGDVIGDQLQQAALASSQWGDVQTQLNAEGITDPQSVLAVKETFTTAYQQLIAPANGFGLASDPGSALDAAKQLTIVGQTALGAVNTVGGLIHELSSETPQQVMQAFTGGMVALAVGAGAVSAGLGAAIVAGVGALLDVLQQSGLFGTPAGVQISGCSGTYYNPPPTMAVGCVGGFCAPNLVQVSPSTSQWRSFPKPGNGADAAWFSPNTDVHLGLWKNVDWWWPGSPSNTSFWLTQPSSTRRPIDAAFPNYNWVERGTVGQAGAISISPLTPGSAFLQGFASAWRANAEYAFNGLEPRSDEQVLLHYLRVWNRSHGGTTVVLYQGGQGSYAESLVTAALGKDRTFDSGDGGLLVKIGDLQSPPSTSGASAALVSTGTVSGGGLSTGGKIAAGIAIGGGALLLGTAGYAAYTHRSLGQVWTSIGKKVRLKR